MASTFWEHWRLWTPAVAGYVANAVCPMVGNDGHHLPQRPPAYVFRIVWPILYLLTGYAWNNARSPKEVDIMFTICTLLLTAWIVVYSCMKSKKGALFVLSSIVATVVCCMCLSATKSPRSTMALTPLLTWTLVALMLNWHIITN